MVNVHSHCQVAPPALGDGVTAEISLPLTFFDLTWIHFPPMLCPLFYKFPCSTSHFHQTVVPKLKNSLSQTLKHYLPLAGNLYVPLNSSNLPELRYVPGDSVSFTVAETSEDSDSGSGSDSDFEYLISNQPRDADKFYPFVPNLSLAETDKAGSFKTISLLALQVTLFPEEGICIGITNHHVAGDASSIVGFIKAWCALARFDDDEEILTKKDSYPLPIFDRSLIQDPTKRANLFWNQKKGRPFGLPPQILPTNKVRQTFVMSKDDIRNLRNLVLSKKPELTHLSTFTISSAYVWSCLAQIAAETGEVLDDEEPEYFTITVDVRSRLDPPLPATYFGNCLDLGVIESTHGALKSSGECGFLNAVEAASKVIGEKVNNKEELLKGADEWGVKYPPLFMSKRVFGVAGSPKFDFYDTDFGWGNPVKYELMNIDGGSSITMLKSRELEGGLEISLSRSKDVIKAFEGVFYGGLKV